MNIQRLILPASFAAVFHAALLFGFPGKTVRDFVLVTEVLIPPPPKTADEVVAPPPAKGDTIEPVRPLAGGPTPPELDPLPRIFKRDDITMVEESRPRNPSTEVEIIPKIPGLDDIGVPGTEQGWKAGIPSLDQLDRTPSAKVQPSPDYPARMRQDGIGGSVVVEFEVNTAGQVVRAEATRYTHREFVEPALRAVRNWRFEPGRRAGQVVPFRMAVPIEFGLDRN